MFHEVSYYKHSCLVSNEEDVLYTDIKGQGCSPLMNRWWHDQFLLSYNDDRCRIYYTSSQAMRQERTRQFRKYRNRFHPLSRFRNFWIGFMLPVNFLHRFLLHQNTTILYGESSLYFYFLGVVVELIMLIDVLVSFKTGYIEKESGNVILNRYKSHMHFASTKLFTHVASAMPLHLILFLRYGRRVVRGRYKANRFVCCIKLASILSYPRIHDASTFLSRPRHSYMTTHLLTFLRIIVVGLTTMLQCFSLADALNVWAMVSNDEIREGSYFELIMKMKYVSAQRPSNAYWLCAEISLICKSLMGYESGMKGKYYYLDILFSMSNSFIAGIFFMWSFMEYYAVLARMKYSEDQIYSHVEQSLNMILGRQLSDSISQRVKDYYDFNMSKLRVFEKHNELYQSLLSSLYKDMQRDCYLNFLKRITEFKEWPPYILEEITALIQDEIFLESDLVADAWQPGQGLIILYAGVLAVYNTDNEEIGHLIDGDYFDEISLVTDKDLRISSVVASTKCKILILRKSDFRKFMRSYPDLFFSMQRKLQENHKTREIASDG